MSDNPPAVEHHVGNITTVVCPTAKEKWNLHPRVYLALPTGKNTVDCPYCGTRHIVDKSE